MTRLLAAVLSTALLLLIAAGVSLADEPEDDAPYVYTRSGTGEGQFRAPLPLGEYACRFIDDYDATDDGYPDGYIDARAWLLDESDDSWYYMDRGDIKFVSVASAAEDGPSVDDVITQWVSSIQSAFAAFDTHVAITDTTPLIDIHLSRGFRAAGASWTFTCVAFAWPD